MKIRKKAPAHFKAVKALPYHWYLLAAFTLAAAGLIDSIYLTFSHYRTHTDILYTSFCAISKALNCDTVAQSPYSIFMGVPLAVWGMIGYTLLLVLLVGAGSARAGKKRGWALILMCSVFFSIHSIVLAAVSRYLIKAYCIMCIVSYGINFVLVFQVWIIRRRFPDTGFFSALKKDLQFLKASGKRVKGLIAGLIILVFLLPAVFPRYWQFELPSLSSNIATGMTDDGSPWIGALDPEIVIVEYTDYQCFQCKKAHFYLRQILAENSDKIRLVHRHFPMVPQFNPMVKKALHPGSGKMAIAAAYAAAEGRFWQMNDLLYQIPKGTRVLDLKTLSEESGVALSGLETALTNRQLNYKILKDVRAGLKLGVTGTPAYEVKGNLYQGRIPTEIFQSIGK